MPTMYQGFKDGDMKWFEGSLPEGWSRDEPKKRGRPKKKETTEETEEQSEAE